MIGRVVELVRCWLPRYRPSGADQLLHRATDAAQHADLAFIGAMARGDANPELLSEVGGLLARVVVRPVASTMPASSSGSGKVGTAPFAAGPGRFG